jgi:hypothetical protein
MKATICIDLGFVQVVMRRDLHRAKEVNMKLAAKMTRMEAQAYGGGDSGDAGGNRRRKGLFGRQRISGGGGD